MAQRGAANAAQFFTRHAAAPHIAPRQAVPHNGEDPMFQLAKFVKSFVREEEGQDLLEYALLVALIAIIAIGAVGLAGGAVNDIFADIAGRLNP
jgi:pilus assembly protein Flp/PilA